MSGVALNGAALAIESRLVSAESSPAQGILDPEIPPSIRDCDPRKRDLNDRD
jgi:hypothetical protein